MVNIILSGAMGAMGREIADTDGIKVLAGVDVESGESKEKGFRVYKSFEDIPENLIMICDCIVDFSHPSALPQVLSCALSNKIPLVIGTTGLSDFDTVSIENASQKIPIVFTSNMSQGINAIVQILGPLAKTLSSSFDMEIVEKHHNRKKDAPSGTALLLADKINNTLDMAYDYTYNRAGRNAAREKNEIGISSIRGGTIPGEHTVIFAGEDEIIEIKHIALSRRIFALGAARAAEWVVNQPAGLYTMVDVISDRPAGQPELSETTEVLDELNVGDSTDQ